MRAETILRRSAAQTPAGDSSIFPLEGFPLVVAVLVVYSWLFAWFPALRSPNELSRLYQTRAIVNDGALPLEREINRRGLVGDLAFREGHYYAAKAPGISLVGVPVYAALARARGGDARVSDRAGIYFLRLFACALPAALGAEAMRRILARRFERRLAAAGAALLALGTLVWPYATQLASHATTAAALLACWDALDRSQETGRARYLVVAGFTGAAAVLFEYTSVLLLLPLAGYGLLSSRSRLNALLFAMAGALLPLTALALFHQAAFGSPLANPYSYLANPTYAQWHGRGLFGVGPPRLEVLTRSFFDPSRGLFAYAPFLALGVVGLPALYRKDRRVGALCAAAVVLGTIFISGFEMKAWGWGVGPRHLTPLCIFLIPPAIGYVEQLRSRELGLIAQALAAYSVLALALIAAVCPYLPDDLTNPIHQLVLPFALEGFHVADLGGMATGVRTPWTLLPWMAALVALALPAVSALGCPNDRSVRRARSTAVAALGAVVLMLAGGTFGGPDRFEGTRAFVRSVYQPTGPRVPRLFDPP